MLIRRRLPLLHFALGLIFLMAAAAALGRRTAFVVAEHRAGRLPIPAEPIRMLVFLLDAAILCAALPAAMGLLRFHGPSRRVLIASLVAALVLVVYRGWVALMPPFHAGEVALYGAALGALLGVLAAFNRSDIAEMYGRGWEGHDIPSHPVPIPLIALVAAAGVVLGVVLQHQHARILVWLYAW